MRAALLVFALALAFAPAARALPEETWVVAFSSNHGDAGEVPLLYADRDAQQLAAAFDDSAAVAAQRTLVVANASAKQVRDTLLDVNARIRERSTQATTALVVYYSGHADAAELHLGGDRMRFDELKLLVQSSAAAIRLLVVDACRSGSVTRVKGMVEAPAFALDVRGEPAVEGTAIMTSSAAGEASQESDALRSSFFTHHLVNALRGAADENEDGTVTLAEAYSYTYSQTLRSSGRTLTLQHPTYSYDLKGRGDLVLARAADVARRYGRLHLAEPTTYVVAEGREGGPVVAEVQPPRANAVLALAEGSYFVQERLPSEYREYDLQITAGKETSLAGVPYRVLRYDKLVRRRGSGGVPEQEGPRSVHGLFALAAGRGEAVAGEGRSLHGVLGWNVDLPWFTLGARLRGSTLSAADPEGRVPRRHDELGLGVALLRVVDFEPVSIGFGLLGEAVLHEQTFPGPRAIPDRRALGASFGGIVSLERHLAGGLALHLEGGPVTLVFPEAHVVAGAQRGESVATPFTWWTAGGLLWRL